MRKLGIVCFYLVVASCVADSTKAPKTRSAAAVVDKPQTTDYLPPLPVRRPVEVEEKSIDRPPRHPKSKRRSEVVASVSLSQESSLSRNGNWLIQLASVRNETQARQEWHRLLDQFPNILYDKEPMIVRANLRGRGVFYRLRVGGFERKAKALLTCTDIRARGGSCLPMRNHGQHLTTFANLCVDNTLTSSTTRMGGKEVPLEAAVLRTDDHDTQKNVGLAQDLKLQAALLVNRGKVQQKDTSLAGLAEIELTRKAAVQELGKEPAARNAQDKELYNAVKAVQALKAETQILRKTLAAKTQQFNRMESALTAVLKMELAEANAEIARLRATLNESRKR